MGRLQMTDSLLLTQRNVYILPTRAGWMLAATLGVLLIAAINYQLNLGYLLTFLLAGCVAAGMVVSHGTLRGLRLHLQPPQPLFAGALATLDIKLSSARRAPRHAIGVALEGTAHWAWADVPGQGEAAVQISFQPPRRGLHRRRPFVPVAVAGQDDAEKILDLLQGLRQWLVELGAVPCADG
jgi:uncharacterized protein (DUF58 family)